MSFWNTAMQFFWREESLPILVTTLAMAFLLFHLLKEDRKSVLNTLVFFVACLALQFISGLIHAMQFASIAAVFHETGLIGAGIAVIRMVGLLIFRIVLPRIRVTPPRITEDIFVIIAYIAWGLVRLRYAGLDLGSIVATSAMITAVVAFAMQDTLGNILGGLALQLDNSVEIGDWIKVDDISGRVVDIRWRSTLVETRNWETVVFPNSQLMKNKFLVLGRRTDQPVQWRRWVWFNVRMDISPTKVVSVVEDAILQTGDRQCGKGAGAELRADGDGQQGLCTLCAALLADRFVLQDDATDAMVRWHIMTALQRVRHQAGDGRTEHPSSPRKTKNTRRLCTSGKLLLRIKTLRRVELFSQMTEEELSGAG